MWVEIFVMWIEILCMETPMYNRLYLKWKKEKEKEEKSENI